MAVHGGNLARVKRYIPALWANKSSKGRWDVVGSSVLQGRQWGHLCLEKELTGGMCRLKGNMNLKWSVAV